MTQRPELQAPRPRAVAKAVGAAALVGALAAAGWVWQGSRPQQIQFVQPAAWQAPGRGADPLDGGVAWLNTGGPIKLHELKGKVVLLDFWTYCCINCHHVLPELAKLEEKYKNELVVIGVHTPKFAAERDSENIRQKVREYRVKHPVVNDADMTIWNRFGVESWPTLAVIDPEGNFILKLSGEGHGAQLDHLIAGLVAKARARGDLNETPVQFFPENEKPDKTPLLYPGKVLADAAGKRLFIADTGHNRIVRTDLDGKHPVLIGGGGTGLTDGAYDKAEFNRPQGIALAGEVLYVADTENHAVRAVDLKSQTVTTLAGNGQQGHRTSGVGPAKTTSLNSPWDLLEVPKTHVLLIAMAGPHQIWKLDLARGEVGVWAGTGRENIVDGPIEVANFAQPSGLATDGASLFVADSEVSAVRQISLGNPPHFVRTIVGEGLFDFGDIDGRGEAVRLQHDLGVAWADGKLYIADSYNNKVKVCDPETRMVRTLAGTGKPGDIDGPATGPKPARLYQPGGLSAAGGKLYVADTNNHKVRVVDLATREVTSLDLGDLSMPKPPRRRPAFVNAVAIAAPKAEVAPGEALDFDVSLPLPEGYHLNEGSPLPVLVETPGKSDVLAADYPVSGSRVEPPALQFRVAVKLAKPAKGGESVEFKVSVAAFVCSDGSNLCTIKSYLWTVPVTFADGGATAVALGAAKAP